MLQRWLAVGLVLVAVDGLVAQDKVKAFDAHGVKLHYTDEGKGEPVILVHGFAVNSQVQWELPGVSKALAKDYRVITMDNRGHGRSGKPHDPKQYGMEMVEDVVRLMDHLKIQRSHVVGYSMGAFITLKLLTTHPERLLSATLGGAGRGRPGETKFLDELAESLEKGKGFAPLILRLNPPGKPMPTEQEVQSVNMFLTAMNDTKALAAVIRAMKDLGVEDEKLKSNKVPVLALIGDLDPLKTGVDDLKGVLAHFQVVVIPGADHVNAFTRPEFVASLQQFLAKKPSK